MEFKKAYKEALERAKAGMPLDEVFPELKESEDERIREEIIEFLTYGIWSETTIDKVKQSQRYAKWIYYLEKQKEQKTAKKDEIGYDLGREQGMDAGIEYVLNHLELYGLCKPAEWSEEDNNALALFHELISFGYTERFCDAQTAEDMRRWLNERLKSLRPQPKQEWNEEFLRLMGITISQDGNQVCVLLGENLAEGIAGFGDTLADAVEEFKKEWRQFDRFRKATWKPSEEQMKWLKDVIETVPMTCRQQVPLESLYADLKKLL